MTDESIERQPLLIQVLHLLAAIVLVFTSAAPTKLGIRVIMLLTDPPKRYMKNIHIFAVRPVVQATRNGWKTQWHNSTVPLDAPHPTPHPALFSVITHLSVAVRTMRQSPLLYLPPVLRMASLLQFSYSYFHDLRCLVVVWRMGRCLSARYFGVVLPLLTPSILVLCTVSLVQL